MLSLEGVPSSLILRNQSWVRQQASALARRLPANVEKADLIQAGLIAVAQAARSFDWPGEPDSDAAREAFVRYARHRVKGAMLDELRQMDQLSRADRRRLKLLEVARERWRQDHGAEPGAGDLAALCGLELDEVSALQATAQASLAESLDEAASASRPGPPQEPATAHDEVEARVDTGMLMRRLERFFARLPERDRLIIDAYLGVGLTPVQVAESLQMTRSGVSRAFTALVERIRLHQGGAKSRQRATDRTAPRASLEELISQREAELAARPHEGDWARRLETVLAAEDGDPDGPVVINMHTRWG